MSKIDLTTRLQQDTAVLAPGVYDALTALLAEQGRDGRLVKRGALRCRHRLPGCSKRLQPGHHRAARSKLDLVERLLRGKTAMDRAIAGT